MHWWSARCMSHTSMSLGDDSTAGGWACGNYGDLYVSHMAIWRNGCFTGHKGVVVHCKEQYVKVAWRTIGQQAVFWVSTGEHPVTWSHDIRWTISPGAIWCISTDRNMIFGWQLTKVENVRYGIIWPGPRLAIRTTAWVGDVRKKIVHQILMLDQLAWPDCWGQSHF